MRNFDEIVVIKKEVVKVLFEKRVLSGYWLTIKREILEEVYEC